MKFECVDQRFGLECKPKRDDYRWVVNRKREARMVKIKGDELEEEGLAIPPLQTTFPRFVEVIRSGMEDLHISALECQDKESVEKMKVKAKDEMLPQLFVHTVDDVFAKAFVKKLAKGEAY